MNIEKALEQSREPGSVTCAKCGDELFSPVDKLSVYLYGKCLIHLNELQEGNLLKITELI